MHYRNITKPNETTTSSKIVWDTTNLTYYWLVWKEKSQCVYGKKHNMIVCVLCVAIQATDFCSILFVPRLFVILYYTLFLLVGVGYEISQYCERFSTAIQSQHTQMYWYLKGISVFFSYSIEGKWFFFPLLSHVFLLWFSRRNIFYTIW